MIQQRNKRPRDEGEDRDPKRQRRIEESSLSSTVGDLVRPTATGHSLSQADALYSPQRPTFEVTQNSPRTDAASAPTNEIEQTSAVNTGGMSTLTRQPSNIVIPSKRSYPCEKDLPTSRKKRKTDGSVTVPVRVYEQRKDLEHTDEVECALTPDGGLDLAGLSERLNGKGKGFQVSQFIIL